MNTETVFKRLATLGASNYVRHLETDWFSGTGELGSTLPALKLLPNTLVLSC